MPEDFLNSMRLSKREQRDLLRSLEQTAKPVDQSRRMHERIAYHVPGIPLVVTHPDSAVSRFLVCARNISAGGISFLHGGFLYPGSRCELTLPTVWGGQEAVVGQVVSCRHVEKQTHEFGVAFDALIDRRRFITLPGEQALESEPACPSYTALSGRALMVDSCVMNIELARHHVRESGVEIIGAETASEGIVEIRSKPIDVVIVNIDAQTAPSESMVLLFRDAGFKGPIIVTTSNPESSRAKGALATGVIEVLTMPLGQAPLIRVLTESLSGSGGDLGPIPCLLKNEAGAAELVENYLEYVETLVATLVDGIESENLEEILKVCHSLSQSAGGYGYPPLESVAKAAMTALQDSMSVSESLGELQRLRCACSRLEPISTGA